MNCESHLILKIEFYKRQSKILHWKRFLINKLNNIFSRPSFKPHQCPSDYYLSIYFQVLKIYFYLSFRPIFRSYKPLDENFGDSVLPEVEVPEVRDQVKDELEHEHEALKMENLVKTNLSKFKIYDVESGSGANSNKCSKDKLFSAK